MAMVLYEVSDGIATLTLNRPDKRNALDGEMFSAIVEAGESLKTAQGVRAVVISGVGASFCAGLDFGSFQGMASGSANANSANSGGGGEGNQADTQEPVDTHERSNQTL